MKYKCKHCSKNFERSKGEANRGRTKYCSKECYFERRKEKRKERVDRVLRTGKKQCQLCKETKSVKEFFKRRANKDGYGSYCKPCKIKYNRENNKKHKHKHLEQRKNAHLLNKYGITLGEYKAIRSKQGGLCAICRKKDRLCVDHDHSTGEIRGLLCDMCNRGLGLFYDDELTIRRANIYLRNYKQKP